MHRQQKTSGFTLTELLLVVTLLGVAMLLVGPLTVQQIEKFQQKNEVFTLERILKKLSFQAFVEAKPMQLYLQGKAMYLLDNTLLTAALTVPANQTLTPEQLQLNVNQQPYYVFDKLFFDEQLLQLNANGFYQNDQLQLKAGQQTQQLQLNPQLMPSEVSDGR
ncbi:prepilin-type N-terminal cleavage/methylation domain-containing protein [Rheinheimera sp.]|uniref:prepilin-type N-terminal cleavage/methylation domain-containing protein n=1 Tax=Rheinheimera sp. TaxID=1869214 RepID=UPI0027B8B9F6|nr:prepilin-type N-terminal cleavage/methylation domain-containing protein [Rheinheimera sp.]